ncbi:MarR family transcriptional regulator [Pantoea agglomerans]|uniref:MarR family transcriptional regulator n=1 Tax=Enterobacter agglomerans TaxID=549 RepID=UPI0015C59091|nr:MarR family transcriptional regulator [Pantoea agglomerans]NYB31514.1 MarR family transcriptional regulator [Pantoea agglomerans]
MKDEATGTPRRLTWPQHLVLWKRMASQSPEPVRVRQEAVILSQFPKHPGQSGVICRQHDERRVVVFLAEQGRRIEGR